MSKETINNAKFKTLAKIDHGLFVSFSLSGKTAILESFLKTFSCEYLKANAHICQREKNVLGENIK